MPLSGVREKIDCENTESKKEKRQPREKKIKYLFCASIFNIFHFPKKKNEFHFFFHCSRKKNVEKQEHGCDADVYMAMSDRIKIFPFQSGGLITTAVRETGFPIAPLPPPGYISEKRPEHYFRFEIRGREDLHGRLDNEPSNRVFHHAMPIDEARNILFM